MGPPYWNRPVTGTGSPTNTNPGGLSDTYHAEWMAFANIGSSGTSLTMVSSQIDVFQLG
jgi:hypothetical protein